MATHIKDDIGSAGSLNIGITVSNTGVPTDKNTVRIIAGAHAFTITEATLIRDLIDNAIRRAPSLSSSLDKLLGK